MFNLAIVHEIIIIKKTPKKLTMKVTVDKFVAKK